MYAGFWKRFAAYFIDMLLLTVFSFIGGLIFGFLYHFTVSTGTIEGGGFVGGVVGIFAGWIYYAAFESSEKQSTPGKMTLSIKVTDLDGNRISFGRATGRYFAMTISAIILMIGFLMIAFTKKKQGLHDMIAGCLVINKA